MRTRYKHQEGTSLRPNDWMKSPGPQNHPTRSRRPIPNTTESGHLTKRETADGVIEQLTHGRKMGVFPTRVLGWSTNVQSHVTKKIEGNSDCQSRAPSRRRAGKVFLARSHCPLGLRDSRSPLYIFDGTRNALQKVWDLLIPAEGPPQSGHQPEHGREGPQVVIGGDWGDNGSVQGTARR